MTKQSVSLWFDTLCPWAWMTSRWLREVSAVRNVDITWNVMSLYFLNKDRPTISAEYLDNAKKALGPLRIISQAEKIYGPKIKGDLYTAFGEEIHLNKMKFSEELNVKAIAKTELLSYFGKS